MFDMHDFMRTNLRPTAARFLSDNRMRRPAVMMATPQSNIEPIESVSGCKLGRHLGWATYQGCREIYLPRAGCPSTHTLPMGRFGCGSWRGPDELHLLAPRTRSSSSSRALGCHSVGVYVAARKTQKGGFALTLHTGSVESRQKRCDQRPSSQLSPTFRFLIFDGIPDNRKQRWWSGGSLRRNCRIAWTPSWWCNLRSDRRDDGRINR